MNTHKNECSKINWYFLTSEEQNLEKYAERIIADDLFCV